MNTAEFKELITRECGEDLVCFTDLGDEAIVTIRNDRLYMGGTMTEAIEFGYPVDGLMLVSRTREEAMGYHMRAVAEHEAKRKQCES